MNTGKINRRDLLATATGALLFGRAATGAVLPPDYLDTVVSIGLDDLVIEDGKQVIRWVTSASGFLFGYPLPKTEGQDQRYWIYLVTNQHVLKGQAQINVPFNSRSGSATKYPIPLAAPESAAAVFLHPNVDLAVIRLNAAMLERDGLNFKTFVPSNLATREMIAQAGIAVGDGVFVLGFPVGIAGVDRNFVVAKQGIIARLTATRDPSQTNEYLIDAMIFPGNSGGPVVTRFEVSSISGTKAVASSYLLGVVYQFIPYTDVAVSKQTNRPRIAFEENSGLASVIPCDYIDEAVRMHLKALEVPGSKAK